MGKHTTAGNIATLIRKRMQERTNYLPDRKLYALLYLVQRAWLTTNDQPLFLEPIIATKSGVEVATGHDDVALDLDDDRWALTGVTVARYGGLSAMDLESLVRGQEAWSSTAPGQPIDVDAIRQAAREQDETPEGTLSGFTRSKRQQWHPPHDPDRPRGEPDSREEIEAFIADVKARM